MRQSVLNAVRYLSKAAFAIDGALKYVYLGKSIETVGVISSMDLSSLEEVTFPEGTK